MQAVIVKMVKMMQNSKSQQRRQILCDIEN